MFSLRIVSTSHYQAEPVPDLDVTYSSFRSADVKRVPILRIFGATPAGQKTCMHVHGVFPYLYVPYDGTQPVDNYMRRFAASLDKAISVANNSNVNNQHVFKISLVSGIPMYGYHADEQQFLKIYMYNPNTIRKAADLLLGGAVMNKSFQPHEAHIPFPLQLFIDYNLYGMNLINVAAVKFRRPKKESGDGKDPEPSTSAGAGDASLSNSPEDESGHARTPFIHSLGSSYSSSTPSMQRWDMNQLPSDLLLPSRVERQSVCELEVDIVAADILNRREVTDNIGGNPGLAALWEDERQRRRDAGQSSQITPQESQEHDHVEVADSEKQLMERLAEIIEQHRALRRSESDESSVSVEDSMLSQGDVSCIPASQLEDHSVPAEDSQGLPLSQETVIVEGEEEEKGDEDNAPIISLESIQRVVSFSQSFSRPASQASTTTPAEGEEAADRSLAEVLAALAEDNSPASSQHSASQVTALEEQDSVMGQDIALPPDEDTLQEDEEETLQMSQILPEEEEEPVEDREDGQQDENANFNLEGLDASWNESSDNDCVMQSDDEDDGGDIPQLDGTSDEKPASESKSKKRLGVRGPVLSTGSTSGQSTGAGSSSGEQGVTSPGPAPYGGYTSPSQQPQGMYPHNYPHQWAGEGGSPTGVMGRPPPSGHGQPPGGFGAGWPQSSPHHSSYPTMYGGRGQTQQPGNGYGYYPYPQRQPFSPAHSQASGSMHGQFSPSHPNFSPPPRSPMSPSYGLGGGGGGVQGFQPPAPYPHSQSGTSPQHQGPFAQPQQASGSQSGMAGMRRHSMGSIGPSPQHGAGAMGWPNPRPGFSSPVTRASPCGPPDPWSSPYSGSAQNASGQPREPPHQVSELQALLEAPSTSSNTANTATPSSSSSVSPAPLYRRTLSADCNTNAGVQVGGQSPPELAGKGDGSFKLPEKRSGSFSSSSAGSALSSLYNFVSNVDPSARTPTPTSTITPSTTPNSAPSPSLQAREEESKLYVDLSSGVPKTSPLPPSPHPTIGRSMSLEETSTVGTQSHQQGSTFSHEDKTMKKQEGQDGGESAASTTPAPVTNRNERLGKQAKMRKLGLTLPRPRPSSVEGSTSFHQSSNPSTPTPCASYTYTFHVPSPVFKRLKVQGVFPPLEREEVKVVRMHPRDARRYSLLKIGREIVRVSRLSPREVSNICSALSVTISGQKISSCSRAVSTSLHGAEGGSADNGSDVFIMQSSRIVGTSRRMVAGRLVGPKCKKKTTRTEGSTQTVSLASDPSLMMTGDEGSRSGDGNRQQTGQVSKSVNTQSSGGQTNVCDMTPQHDGAGTSGSNSDQWQGPHTKSSQPVPVKTEYPPQSPTASVPQQPHWGMGPAGNTPPGPWGQGMGGGQWPGSGQGQWQMGGYGSWQRGPQVNRGGDGFGYPPSSKEEKALQSPTPFQYPHPPWSSPTSSSSGQSPSTSSSQLYPSSTVSPCRTADQGGAPAFSYPNPYGQSYNPYHSAQYNQSASYNASSGHSTMSQGMSGNKFMPGAYHASGTGGYHPRHPHFPTGQGPGQGGFPPSQHNPHYPMPPGYPGSSPHSGYMSPSGQQGSFPGMGGSATGFPPQHNGSFSPPASHGTHTSPPTSSYGQMSPVGQHSPLSPPVSATINHRPQFFPPTSHPGQFSPPTHPQYPSFPGQQNQYPNQVPGHQFTQPMQTTTNSSSGSNFLPPDSQPQPFLTQGACRDTTSRATDPSESPALSSGSKTPHPDRPRSANGPGQSSSPSSDTAARRPHSASSEAPSGLDHQPQHAVKSASESDSSADSRRPSHDIAELLSMSEKRSKLKQTPEDFLKYQDMPVDSPKAKKKQSKKEKKASENIEAPLQSEEDPDHENAIRVNSKLSLKSGKKKSRTKSSGISSKDSEHVDAKTVPVSKRKPSQNQDESHGLKSSDTACSNRRRTSIELMSPFESDEDFDDESDDSCDDYRPGRRMKGVKRKRSSKGDSRRTKRASVNYGRNAFSQFLEEEEEKDSYKGRKRNAKHSKKKSEKLIEGIHYIVVGKFKGHRIMLVKVNRVKVTLNERVNVSEWLGCCRTREAGDTLHTISGEPILGFSQKNSNMQNCVDHIGTNDGLSTFQELKDAPGSVSDASTIVEEEAEDEELKRNASQNETAQDHSASESNTNKTSLDSCSASKISKHDGESQAEKGAQQVTGTVSREHSTESQEAEQSTTLDACMQDANENSGRKSSQQEDCPEQKVKNSKIEAETVREIEQDIPAAGKEKNSSEKPLERKVESVQDIHMKVTVTQDSVALLDVSKSKLCEETDPETRSTPADNPPKLTLQDKGLGKALSSAEIPRSTTPVSKPGKLLIDSPSVVYQSSSGEHSQDADCSSLPHSNPESNSSSPVFPRMSFSSNRQCNGSHSELTNQSKSESKHLDLPEQRDSDKKCPDTFCFQISHKVKETCKPLQDLDDSSDSTDSNACFSDGPAYGDDHHTSSEPVSFPRKKKLTGLKEVDAEKDKLKKQKTLTTNQRLGVAFLSKKRKKVKKAPVRKTGRPKKNPKGERASNKLMNSLSVLHMATLASLEGDQSTADDSQKFSENVIRVTENAVKVTESVVKMSEEVVQVSEGLAKFSEDTIKVSEDTAKVIEDIVRVSENIAKDSENIGVNGDVDTIGEDSDTVVCADDKDFKVASIEDCSGVDETKVTEDCDLSVGNCGEVALKEEEVVQNSDTVVEDNHIVHENDTSVSESVTSAPPQARPNPRNRRRLMRRKKTPKTKKPSKLMNSLSLLHMATLANLEDQPITIHKDTSLPRSCDAASDDSDKFQDSLNKMSYISPVESDKEASSPPVPLTPEDFTKRTKEVTHKPLSSSLRIEENLGTCALRVSELKTNPSSVDDGSVITPTKANSIPLSSPYRPPLSKTASDSDSDGSVLSDTIPHISFPSKQQSSESSETAKSCRSSKTKSASDQSSHSEQQPSRVLAEKTNCLSHFGPAQESLNLKEMVSKSSAYPVSNMSIRDLFSSSKQSDAEGENQHSETDSSAEAGKGLSSNSFWPEPEQLGRVCEKQDQEKVPCSVPLTLDVSDANRKYEQQVRKVLPGRAPETDKKLDSPDYYAPCQGQRELGLSRTERIISQMLGVDPKQVKDKPSPSSRVSPYNYNQAAPVSPRGYKNDGLLSTQDRNGWQQHPGWDDYARVVHSQTGNKTDRHWLQSVLSKSPGSSTSPGRSRVDFDGADHHQSLTHSPSAYPSRSPGSAYDYSGKASSHSPGRYAVSPKSLNEYRVSQPALSPSKYATSPRSVDEYSQKHLSTSPGRYQSSSPARHMSTSPGRYDATPPGRYTSTSPGRYGVSPRSKDEYMGMCSGLSGTQNKYGVVSPECADHHRGRQTSPGRYSGSPGSSRHVPVSPGRYPVSPGYGTDSVHKHTSLSPGRYPESSKETNGYLGKAAGTSPSKSPVSPGVAVRNDKHTSSSRETQSSNNKQRSIGDYLDEMIESAFAEIAQSSDNSTVPKLPEFENSRRESLHSYSLSGRPSVTLEGGSASAQTQYTPPKRDFGGRADLTYSDKAIDLSAPKTSTVAHSPRNSVAPCVAKPTTVVSHPTWTTIKTDKFENITDDEDDDVIPSSQEYSANVYRYPGFGRLSTSVSPTWGSYMTPGKASYGAQVPVSSQPSGRSPRSEQNGSEMYKANHSGVDVGRERPGQVDLHVYGSSSSQPISSSSFYKSYLTSPARSIAPSSYSSLHSSQNVPVSYVTSFSTQWKDTQTQGTEDSTPSMPNFEPITDSEDEEGNKSPPKSTHRENGALHSAWTGTTSGRMPYRYTGLTGRDGDRTSSHSQPVCYSVAKSGPLSLSSVPHSASSGYSGAAAEYPYARTFSVSTSHANSSMYSVSQHVQGNPSLDRSRTGESSSVHTTSENRWHGHSRAEVPAYRCAGGSGGKDSDDDGPEDGGGRKRRKPAANRAPSGDASSSQGGSAGAGQRAGGHGDSSAHYDPSSGDGEGPWSRSLGTEPSRTGQGYVLCPKAPPPSRELVNLTAVSLGLSAESSTRAYCSNPADLPDRPRELGGRVLRIGTNMVTELEEVAPPTGVTSLREWQTILVADSSILPSQDPASAGQGQESLRDRLDDSQLRRLLMGDSPCVITPVLPPPSHTAVSIWIEEKLQSLASVSSVEKAKQVDDDGQTAESSPDSPAEDKSTLVGESSVLNSSGEEETLLFTKLKEKEGKGAGTSQATDTTPLKPKDSHGEDDDQGASLPKRQRLDSDGVMHSTPVRRTSGELFEAGCTPISSKDSPAQAAEADSGKSEGAPKEEFVTPKRPPLRRLSTNTESALRRAIDTSQQRAEGFTSQIDGPTPKNTHGFKVTQQKLQDAKALHKHQFLTVLSMELHIDTRGDLMPDPEVDCIRIVFFAVFDDIPPEKGPRSLTGAIVVDANSCDKGGKGGSPRPSTSKLSATPPGRRGQKLLEKCGVQGDLDVTYVATEADLLHHLIQLIVKLDPDILLGFEVQQLSWGFLLQRAAHLSVNLCAQISRIQGSKQGNRFRAERDEWGADHTSEIHIEGRIMLNLWRVLRHEVTLNIYSYENCAFHILHCRVPTYSFRTLTSWYNHRTSLCRWRVIHHYVERVKGQLAMLDQLDIIGKTSEFARVFGIEFYDVLSRGSQYRVESMMLRLAKPLNFIPVSPSVQQRARQKAPECIPLTLEPESRFYVDPVVVLDFQSLYPSIMIAYNYCFSTCLGRLEHLAQAHEGSFEFGCTSLTVPTATLRKLRKNVTISPNGCVFITRKVRRGVLPMMVEEILKTRLMVKKSMKDYKNDKTLHRMLDARQLGLKLIANVTYGYTGASFSGRMPCIEVGDSIVRKARESLERAIRLVEDTPHWQARVVYGDTDSLFILLPGRTKDQAFVVGQEIADTVSNMFPKPMKLKFEKVYLPCVLQTKKRYVGFMYETKDQEQPVFDAKGIETVRRDNCGVVSKVLEKCIKTLFTMRDVSLVRAYLQRQFTKMLSGRVGLQDYIFAKEYRGMMGYKPGACVPALEIAKRRLKDDRRSEPRVGERVPYVIVHGSPGLPLIQLVRQPGEVLRDTALRINIVYYITKQVLPPLDRLFGLIGINVFQWYNDMPKVIRMAPSVLPAQDTKQGTISQYFVTSDCLVCERQTKQPVCTACMADPQLVAVALASRSAAWEAVQDHLAQVCFTCMGVQDYSQPCASLDCPVLFRRHIAALDVTRADQQREAMLKSLTF